MTMGDRIKALRKENKMTQEELGLRLGINRAAVNKYEKGTVVNIPTDTLLKICSIFDVTPNYLLMGSDASSRKQAMREIRQVLGDEGIQYFQLFADISLEGRIRAIQYLEDMKKIYPKQSNTENECSDAENSNQIYSEQQPTETLPLSNRTINVLLRNDIFNYGDFITFYNGHSFSDLVGTGKNIIGELERFATHALIGAKNETSTVVIEHAFSESRFKLFRTYCTRHKIISIETITPEILIHFFQSSQADLGYLIRIYSRITTLLNSDSCLNNNCFIIHPQTLSAPITILKVFRRMNSIVDILIESKISSMKDFSKLSTKEIRNIIGERAYTENYDIFRMLNRPINEIFSDIFLFVEADKN